MMNETKMKQQPKHGSPADRGGADWWYQRGIQPHMYVENGTALVRVNAAQMTEAQVQEYMDGYNEAKMLGDHKWS